MLLPQVYDELRSLARRNLRRERAGGSIQATALVHEAYLRLKKDEQRGWQNRTHFFAIAATAMRRILIERARARAASKRGGPQVRVTLDDAVAADLAPCLNIIALDETLTRLAEFDPQQARIVELRFFTGLSLEEVAEEIGVSLATVKRDWTMAKAWLRRITPGILNVNSQHWNRIKELFSKAIELDADDSGRFLDDACREDSSLRSEIEALIASHEKAADFIEKPLYESAPELLDIHLHGESLAGKQLGPYSVIRELGQGGMGVVYLAEDTRLKRLVSMKALAPEFTGNEQHRERLRREARATAALTHPGVATVYSLEEFGDTLYNRGGVCRGRESEIGDKAEPAASAAVFQHRSGVIRGAGCSPR